MTMLDTQVEVEEQIGDVVVCDKSSIEAMMRELEERRGQALWTPIENATKPGATANGTSAELLIHYTAANGETAVTTGHYVPASGQWQLSAENASPATIVGWRNLPSPEYKAN